MKLTEDLEWRGLINQTTLTPISKLNEQKFSFYLGVDPSADSMTIGNLAAVFLVKRLALAGHQAFLLVGGATGMIGDPDGKKNERSKRDRQIVEQDALVIAKQFQQIMGQTPFTLVNNTDWFVDISYIDFLAEVGKNVPMSQMLGREFVKARLGNDGSGISYAEFSYVLIQAYDFVHLNRAHGVELQVCGADQWGNSVAGVDLLRRLDQTEAHVLSIPLVIDKTTGRKFGKSETGAVWLDSNKTSVYRFYQFWLNCNDASMADYLKVYTFLTREEIEKLLVAQNEHPEQRLAQKALAYEVTKEVHGEGRAESARKVSEVLFSGRDFESLNEADLKELSHEITTVAPNISLITALVSTGLAKSNSEARRLIDSGAISINGAKIDNDFQIDKACLIKKGKNSFALAY